MSQPEPVTVQIHGASYTIRGDGSPVDIDVLARHVDEIMRDVAQATGLTDSLKIAVMAALHIADDLFRLRREIGAIEGTTEACKSMLDEMLGEGPGGAA